MTNQRRPSWKLPFSPGELNALIDAMLEEAGKAGSLVDLAILDDTQMAELHAQSLGYAGPTNILSFPAGGPLHEPPSFARTEKKTREQQADDTTEETHRSATGGLRAKAQCPAVFLGWMALSADTLQRECFLYGQELDGHCIRLLAHGLAHLLGHDHSPAMDALCERLEAAAARNVF